MCIGQRGDATVLLSSSLIHIKYCVQFWLSHLRQDIGLEHDKVPERGKKIKRKAWEHVQLEERSLQGNVIAIFNNQKGFLQKIERICLELFQKSGEETARFNYEKVDVSWISGKFAKWKELFNNETVVDSPSVKVFKGRQNGHL